MVEEEVGFRAAKLDEDEEGTKEAVLLLAVAVLLLLG